MTAMFRLPHASAAEAHVVIALHCSGSSGRQWRPLEAALGDRFKLLAPDLIGNGTREPWAGAAAFRLADEAAFVVSLIDAFEAPVHLVGHSYGGGVALRAAIERPHRVRSLSLYEPTPFHVLATMGDEGRAGLAEIRAVSAAVDRAVLAGAYRAAAECFVDYWGGAGAFAALKPATQAEIIRYVPKGCLEFRALMQERLPLAAYRRLRIPLMLMRGEATREPPALIVRKLAQAMRPYAVETVAGAGHMGPITHAETVGALIAAHVARYRPAAAAPRPANAAPMSAAA